MSNEVKIKLTDAQKAKIKEATGKDLPEIRVESFGDAPAVSSTSNRVATKAPLRAGLSKAPTRAGLKAPLKAGAKAPLKAGAKAPLKAGAKAPLKAGAKAPLKANFKAPLKANF